MKQIENYASAKYNSEAYEEVEQNIFKTLDEDDEELFVTSLSFVQEPELGEGSSPAEISDYPLEDVLDRFYCHISDYYTEINEQSEQICYLEFGSPELVDVVGLRSIIGKHVYTQKEGDNESLVIE